MAKFPYIIGKWGQGYIMQQQRMILNGLQYFTGLPSWVQNKASLSFNAEWADYYNDYETNKLYFRDSNFDRVAATFSRTSSATRVNKQGLIETVATGIPRIDYTDGTAKLLMEPSRTNLIRYADFNAGVPTLWSVSFSQGTFTHTLTSRLGKPAILHEQTTSGRSPLNQAITFAPSTTYTFTMRVYDVNIVSGNSSFGLISDGVGLTDIGISDIVDGVITKTFTSNASAGTGYIRIGIGAAATSQGSILFGTPQLEAGSYPTSYIPTAGSAVTRNADSATNSSATSYIGQTEGTMYVDIISLSEGTGVNGFYIGDGTANNFVFIAKVGAVLRSVIRANNTSLFTSDYSPLTGNSIKAAVAYKSGDYAYYVNGNLIASGTTAFSFTSSLSLLGFASAFNFAAPNVSSEYKKAILLPTRLANSELQQLTT